LRSCYSCRQNALAPEGLVSRERIFDGGLWRVAHAIDVPVSGWLVVVCRRHVTSMGELTAEEAASLGPLLRAASRALERAFAVRKAYMAFFAEAKDFEHLHIHVLPRLRELPEERRGPRIFLSIQDLESIDTTEMNRVADELRPLIEQAMRSFGA
jgi:diadenosine tetraphosphate (Ap4A) HIT family hydrolase